MHLSWIIPAYNEEKRIEKGIRQVDAYLRSKTFPGDYEIIVVLDEASRDRTMEIVHGLESSIHGLKLLKVAHKGKGWAVKQGMLAGEGDFRLFADADNSTDPKYFDAMEPLLVQQCDIVISSRNPRDAAGAGRDVEEPWYREIMGMMGNIMIQVIGVWGVWDTQNGFKCFTKRAADVIFSQTLMGGWSFDIEVLALAKKYGLRVGIIPIKWRYEEQSTVTLGAYINVFVDVFRIRWNLIIGKYRS